MASFEEDDFIIRKRKKLKRDKHEGLKLILKVGNNSATSTPERPFETPVSSFAFVDPQDDNFNSPSSSLHYDTFSKAHKKSKKKKKKKEKDYEKRDKKKKHRKDKKKRKDSSQDDVRDTEADNANESLGLNISNNFNFIVQNDDKTENSQDSNGGLHSKKNEKTTLRRLLESIHQLIEKKDTQQFFAWPVTDQIAPGYSHVINHPMDLNTMKRNIENNSYTTLPQYIEDLQLMCRNAMVYNRPETIYYKAAKKLLHAGLKITNIDKLRATPQLLPLLSQIPPDELGCEDRSSAGQSDDEEIDSRGNLITNVEAQNIELESKNEATVVEVTKTSHESDYDMKSEDKLADEILQQAKKAAQQAAEKVAQKKISTEMGFLRQKKDGTTTLAIIVPNDGIDEKTRERPVLLGSLIGRLSHGSGSLQGFREDKRNFVKTVKPLYYGGFGSYAPSYDSTFANLTKEESQLLFQTYGDEAAVQYAESVLNFSKDCDYVTTMVDNLLDIMTGGDHRKTKKLLEEKKKIREEEELEEKRLRSAMESKKLPTAVVASNETSEVTNGIKSATVSPISTTKGFNFEEQQKIELNQLKSLSEFGIDTGFIEYFENQQKEEQKINEKLEQTRSMLERLHQTQYERLSGPLPSHLSQIQPATENEHQLAEKVTESLTNIIRKLPPGNIAPVAGVRKAMGIAPVPPQQQQSLPQQEMQQQQTNPISNNIFPTQPFPNNTFQVTNNLDESACIASQSASYGSNQNVQLNSKLTTDEETLTNTNTNLSTAVTGFDFESELREFLENDTTLSSFQLPDDTDDADKTIEQMLSAHS